MISAICQRWGGVVSIMQLATKGQFWLFYLYCTLFCILFDFNSVIVSQWHALSHAEQSKYYELAKKEQQLHMQLFPGWSAKDNYVRTARRQCTMHAHSCLCVRKLGSLLLFFMSRGRWRGSGVSSAEEAFNTSLGSKKTGCRLVKSSTPAVIPSGTKHTGACLACDCIKFIFLCWE